MAKSEGIREQICQNVRKMCGDGMRGRDLWYCSYSRPVLLGLPEASGDHGEVSTADKGGAEEARGYESI